MSSSVFFKGCYGYQNMVPKYLKTLLQTVIDISGWKRLYSTLTLKNPTGRRQIRGINNSASCAHTLFILFCCQKQSHFGVWITNVSNQRKCLCKMRLTKGRAPCGWMHWGTAEAEEQSGGDKESSTHLLLEWTGLLWCLQSQELIFRSFSLM